MKNSVEKKCHTKAIQNPFLQALFQHMSPTEENDCDLKDNCRSCDCCGGNEADWQVKVHELASRSVGVPWSCYRAGQGCQGRVAHHPWDWMSITIPLWWFLKIWCHFRHTQTIGRSSTRTIWLGNGLGEISDRKHLSVTEPLLCWQCWDSFLEKPSDQTQAGDQRTLHILEILAV